MQRGSRAQIEFRAIKARRFLAIFVAAIAVAAVDAEESGEQDSEEAKDAGFVGIAVWIAPDFWVVGGVLPNSPADESGVQAGDYIISIDQKPTSQIQLAEFKHWARGRAETVVELIIRRLNT